MTIESKIDALIAAIEANTAALGAKPAASASKKEDAAPAKTESKPVSKTTKKAEPEHTNEHTREEMQAALKGLKDKKDSDAAKAVIKKVGGVDKMADIPEEKIDAVYAAATEALEAEEDM